ncbi:MAG: VRR-NUC domain-containing protein [Actinomycetota bacterium]
MGSWAMTEQELLDVVTRLAKMMGWTVYHTNRSDRSEPGYPDLTMVRPPRLVYAELKTVKGRLTEPQKRWLDLLGRTAAETYLWRPDDLDSIPQILSRRHPEAP